MRRRASTILPGLLALGLLAGPGCSTNCQQLCTAWYDYQRDVCGFALSDDARVTCISDYRLSRTTTDELAECSGRIVEVEAMASARDATCCTWDLGSCPTTPGDDDDSAAATAR